MVLVGYVSDEFYVAIPNVEIEFTRGTDLGPGPIPGIGIGPCRTWKRAPTAST